MTGGSGRELDIAANRQAQKYTRQELLGRAFWEVLGCVLFRMVPRPLWSIRSGILRAFGARIERGAHICPTANIAIPWNLHVGEDASIGDGAIIYNLGIITIGARVTVSQYAHLCAGTHDHRTSDMRLMKEPIQILEGAWICADAFIGPGVTIGAHAIVGARSAVFTDVPALTIVGGNPARILKQRRQEMRASDASISTDPDS